MIQEILQYHKVYSRWVWRKLMPDIKERHVGACKMLLRRIETESNVFFSVHSRRGRMLNLVGTARYQAGMQRVQAHFVARPKTFRRFRHTARLCSRSPGTMKDQKSNSTCTETQCQQARRNVSCSITIWGFWLSQRALICKLFVYLRRGINSRFNVFSAFYIRYTQTTRHRAILFCFGPIKPVFGGKRTLYRWWA